MAFGKENGGDAPDLSNSRGEETGSHQGAEDTRGGTGIQQTSPLDIDYTGPAIERPPDVEERLAALEDEHGGPDT